MPILNSIGALSIEEGGDNISGNLPVQKSFLKVVPSHTGDTFIIKQLRSFEIYEYSTDSGSYSLAYTIDTPTDFPTQSGVGQNILADDCDIGYGGDRVLVSFYDSNQYNSKVYAYQKVGGLWTLKNSVLDAGVNRNFRFGYSVSMSWADNGCVISSYYGSNAVTGFVYYYGDIWSSTSGTVRSTLPRVSTEVNGAVKEYPFSSQITKDGSYARAATQISGVYANTEVWSITTKSGATLPLNAKWHEFSDKLNLLNREFSAKVLSGDKKVSFEMDAAMTYIKVTRDLVVVPVAPPTISVPVKTFSFDTGAAVNQVVATSTGVGIGIYSVNPALPTGLTFDKSTSTITGTPTTVSSTTLYTVSVWYDGTIVSDTFSLTIVTPRVITVVKSPLTFVVNRAVPITNLVTTSGFVAPITYSIAPQSPTGMSFNISTGALSGTPTVVSSDVYEITARDSSISKTSNVIIDIETDTVITGIVSSFVLGVNKSATVAMASGSTTFFTYSISGQVPTGLTLNTLTGVLSGTATSGFGSNQVTVSARDKYGATKSTTTTINVTSDFVASFNSLPYTFTIGVSNSVSLVSCSGGGNSYTYSVSPALPTGLSINPTNGVISGIASVISSGTYVITVTDRYGITKTGNIRLNTVSDFAVIYVAAHKFTIGTTSRINPVIIGTTSPYTFTVSPALPTGLTLNQTTGRISYSSGTSTYTGTHIITATDKYNVSVSSAIAITITSDLSISSVTQTYKYWYKQSFTQNFGVSGTGTPFTYQLLDKASGQPALTPNGTYFNTTTGVLTGDGYYPGKTTTTRTYLYKVTDKYGVTVSATVNLTLVDDLAFIFKSSMYNATVGQYTSISPGVSGTSIPFTFSCTDGDGNGNLGNGLTLNTSTGVVSGIPTKPSNINSDGSWTSSITVSYTYRINVTDKYGWTKAATLNIVVNSGFRYLSSTKSLNIGTTGQVVNIGPVSDFSGTSAPYTWEIVTGYTAAMLPGASIKYSNYVSPALPAGLTLDPNTGYISGTLSTSLYELYTTGQLPYTLFAVKITNKYGGVVYVAFELYQQYYYKLTGYTTDPTNPACPARLTSGYVFSSGSGITTNWPITNMSGMFNTTTTYSSATFNSDISTWDTKYVTNMSDMFRGATSFNQPLNNWNTANVTNISGMFAKCTSFNQSLNNWNTANVTIMESTFDRASKFNQPLNNWIVANVVDADGTFATCTSFNQNLSTWVFSNITTQPLGFSTSANAGWVASRNTMFPKISGNITIST